MDLRIMGRCPLTPEEAALVLAGLGFKSKTYIYLAGSHIYGGDSRMHPFTKLYPNLVTKESLLTPNELAPFRNFSSQVTKSCVYFSRNYGPHSIKISQVSTISYFSTQQLIFNIWLVLKEEVIQYVLTVPHNFNVAREVVLTFSISLL